MTLGQTIGSTNLVFPHFKNTEMNVSFWDAQTARAFRIQLFNEHGGFFVPLNMADVKLSKN